MMKKNRLTLILIFFQILIPGILLAQLKVTGTVTDAEEGVTLPGVTILEKNSGIGAITDIEGNYEITVPDNSILVFSYVGYAAQEVVVNERTEINIALEKQVEYLDEVVVIGYGRVKKADATGSVVAIGSDDFNKGAISSPQELLMGKSAGVMISAPTGQPGAGSAIRIRGGSSLRASNDPLIVIDGVPITSNTINGMADPLSTINPNDIESFTVLKDASATAIYGSRASNGVIIITTKKGKGNELAISYNGNASIGTPTKFLDVLSADEFRDEIINNPLISDAAEGLLGTADTDWQKEVYRNSFSSDHNLSISGNVSEVLPFRFSTGYMKQEGILEETSMERTTVSIGLSPSFFKDHLKVNLNSKGMFIHNDFANDGAIGESINYDPTQPVRVDDQTYGGYYAWTSTDGTPNFIANSNPVALIEQTHNVSNGVRSIGNLQLDYKFHFLPEMRANLNLGYDYYKSEGDNNTAPNAAFAYRSRQTNVKSYSDIGKNTLLDFYLNYVKEISEIKSNVDFTAGYSYQKFHVEREDANRPWEMTDGEYVGADTTLNKTENALISFFGRLNYTFLDRYLLTVTLRQDGSSRFSEDNRWGLFPSVALAWQINEESFMENIKAVETLKLRLGWGITGQQDISSTNGYPNNYPYLASYNGSSSTAYYRLGNQYYTLWKPLAYDPNIKWEETTTYNIGLDFGLFNDRITGSVEYYKRVTNDLINEIPIPVGTNFANRLVTNVGSLENKGIEASLDLWPISKEKMSLEIGLNFSRNVNEITKLTAFDDPDYIGYEVGNIRGGSDNQVQINSVGHATNTFYLFKQVYGTDGMPIEGLYVDKTGEGGVVDGNDLNRYHMETPTPDFLIGLSTKFVYKNFDFSFAGRLSIGNYVYNNVKSDYALYGNLHNQSGYLTNILKDVSETEFYNAQYKSDIYLENASFFRMDNISVGYNFDKFLMDKLDARLSFTVQNAFVITKYSGLDPEISSVTDPGIDNNLYPRPRTYILGLNINL